MNDLDQELARLDDSEPPKRPHFLDYDPVPPSDFDSIQLPIQPSVIDPLTNGVHHATDAPSHETHRTESRTKKHFLDENPIPPDYDYERRHHRSLDREYDRNGRNDMYKGDYERRHSIERAKQLAKPKEMNYTSLVGGWEPNDDIGHMASVHRELLSTKSEYVRSASKVEFAYSLISVIGQNNAVDISGKFLELSKMPGTCTSLRGCIPWLVTTIHMDADEVTRKQARDTLHNVVHQQDDKAGRREAKVLRHIEQIMDYCDLQKQSNKVRTQIIDSDAHPLQAMGSLMKVSTATQRQWVEF